MKEEEGDFFNRKERKAQRKIASRKDRSKFKKTDSGKRERLLKEQSDWKLSKKDLLRGRVLSILPEGMSVESGGVLYSCVLSGNLKQEISRTKNLLTVGDFVLFEPDKKMIASVEQRYSVLSRQEHLRRRQEQLIAANIDQVLITVSITAPSLKPSLVDRYIIATRKGNMSPVIVINKIDLLPPEGEVVAFLDAFIKTYHDLGFPIFAVSAETGEGIETLKQHMAHKASVFSGQSGVGKSSLINAVTGLSIPTGEVVRKTQKGSHTTTTTQLIPLSFGGWCIATPGIRSFGLWDLKREDLNYYFPEIYVVSQDCKFPNCSHSHEPDCAVRKAVEAGTLSPLRYDSFLRLIEELT